MDLPEQVHLDEKKQNTTRTFTLSPHLSIMITIVFCKEEDPSPLEIK